MGASLFYLSATDLGSQCRASQPPELFTQHIAGIFSHGLGPIKVKPRPASVSRLYRTHTNLRSSVMGMKWYSAWEARSGASVCLQGSAESLRPGLVNVVIAVAYHFFPSLPAAFTQPGLSLLADPCIFLDPLISFLPCQGCGCNKPSVWENPFSGYHRILKESTNVNMP